MAKITLEINTLAQNRKKNTTNVGYINPQATNDKLLQFAQMLVALTTDTHVETTKITKESVI